MSKDYIVQKVMGTKIIDGKTFYRIKWKGYPHENTWEPEDNIGPEVVQEFKQKEEERAIKKEMRQKQFTRDHQAILTQHQILITSHSVHPKSGLIFRVRINPRRYVQMTRDELMQKHNKILAQYYISVLQERGDY